MRKSTPSRRSGLARGALSCLGAAVITMTAACNPVAPPATDTEAAPNRGQGGSEASNAGGASGGSSGGSSGASSGGSSGGASGGGAGSGGATGVAAFATCSSPADMKGVPAADFCTQYMSTCQYGAGAAKFTSEDDCKAKYAGYTPEQKWCTAYHLCKAAENNNAGKDTHCPHTAGGGGDPCKLIAAAAPDAGGATGGDAAAAAPSLKTDIYPLFLAKCQTCHMDLVKGPTDLFKWLNDNAARPACAPTMMPRKAVILTKTNPDMAVATACGGKMPIAAKGDAEIWGKLKAWVADGAKDN
jgi:hypothetical protein